MIDESDIFVFIQVTNRLCIVSVMPRENDPAEMRMEEPCQAFEKAIAADVRTVRITRPITVLMVQTMTGTPEQQWPLHVDRSYNSEEATHERTCLKSPMCEVAMVTQSDAGAAQ